VLRKIKTNHDSCTLGGCKFQSDHKDQETSARSLARMVPALVKKKAALDERAAVEFCHV